LIVEQNAKRNTTKNITKNNPNPAKSIILKIKKNIGRGVNSYPQPIKIKEYNKNRQRRREKRNTKNPKSLFSPLSPKNYSLSCKS